MRTLSLLAALAVVSSAQTGPEILSRVAENYQSLKTYHFEAQVVNESVSDTNESRSRSTRISAAMLPDHRRLETKGGQMASVRIYDGKTVWEFRPGPKQFARQEQASYKPPRMNTLSDPVETYKTIDKSKEPRILREETVEVDGSQHPCWVIEAQPRFPVGGFILERSPMTYWIDKSAYVVLKESETVKMKPPMMDSPQTQKTTTTYTVARINQPVADTMFTFEPPSDATEIGEFTSPFGGGSTLTGKKSPELGIEDFDGKEVTLDTFKGRPMLINFWATWCAPCREQMPRIQEIQRTFADRGLVVLAINQAETPEVAKKYIEEHKYTFRVLLDRDKSVTNRFSVTGIPAVFLIDREGQIKAQFTGYSTGMDLKEELKKIGF